MTEKIYKPFFVKSNISDPVKLTPFLKISQKPQPPSKRGEGGEGGGGAPYKIKHLKKLLIKRKKLNT